MIDNLKYIANQENTLSKIYELILRSDNDISMTTGKWEKDLTVTIDTNTWKKLAITLSICPATLKYS